MSRDVKRVWRALGVVAVTAAATGCSGKEDYAFRITNPLAPVPVRLTVDDVELGTFDQPTTDRVDVQLPRPTSGRARAYRAEIQGPDGWLRVGAKAGMRGANGSDSSTPGGPRRVNLVIESQPPGGVKVPYHRLLVDLRGQHARAITYGSLSLVPPAHGPGNPGAFLISVPRGHREYALRVDDRELGTLPADRDALFLVDPLGARCYAWVEGHTEGEPERRVLEPGHLHELPKYPSHLFKTPPAGGSAYTALVDTKCE